MLLYGLSGEATGLGTDPSTCDPNTQFYDPNQDACLPFSSGCDPNTQYYDPSSGSCLPFSAAPPGAPTCPYGSYWNGATCAAGSPTAAKPSQGSGTPWWAALTQSLATGVTKGFTTPNAPAAPAPAWYTTPAGIGGIALVGILLVVLLRK